MTEKEIADALSRQADLLVDTSKILNSMERAIRFQDRQITALIHILSDEQKTLYNHKFVELTK